MKSLRLVVALVAVLALGAITVFAADTDTTSLKGKPAPAFSLQTIAGKEMSLAGEKGKVVLLDFWATWCPPCRESLPHLQKISEDKEFAQRGLRVYAVNEAETREQAKEYLEKEKLSFPCALDLKGAVGTKYLVRGIPTTVVIGRDGKVADVFVGYSPALEDQVRQAVTKALDAKEADKG